MRVAAIICLSLSLAFLTACGEKDKENEKPIATSVSDTVTDDGWSAIYRP